MEGWKLLAPLGGKQRRGTHPGMGLACLGDRIQNSTREAILRLVEDLSLLESDLALQQLAKLRD